VNPARDRITLRVRWVGHPAFLLSTTPPCSKLVDWNFADKGLSLRLVGCPVCGCPAQRLVVPHRDYLSYATVHLPLRPVQLVTDAQSSGSVPSGATKLKGETTGPERRLREWRRSTSWSMDRARLRSCCGPCIDCCPLLKPIMDCRWRRKEIQDLTVPVKAYFMFFAILLHGGIRGRTPSEIQTT
jgi:hypothetical protein